MGQFDGKVVLITGGARGQGRSHALRFAREGADVAICDIAAQVETALYPMSTADDLAKTARQVEELDRRCLSVTADVRDQSQMTAFVERTKAELGRVDFLLANAGIISFSSVAEMTDDQWDQTISINLSGVYRSIRAVLPTMIEQDFGRIVVTSSMAGRIGLAYSSHYCAAKWGVIGLVKSVALEVGNYNITANAVCPTTVGTEPIFHEAIYKRFVPDNPDATLEDSKPVFASLNAMPLPWIEPIDVSNAMAFLCSDDARYISGETLAVSAGMSARNAA